MCDWAEKKIMIKRATVRKFSEDESGNIAMIFSIAIVAILAMVGAAMDYSMTSSAYSRSQDIADSVALNAAAYVRLNDEIPTAASQKGIKPGDHKASEFGYEYEGWVDGGSDSVNVNVVYDDTAREAIVTVSGQTITSFSKIMGYDSLKFSTQSVVSFENTELNDVASIALVLDNSGSMAWADKPYVGGSAPAGAVSRISALKSSVNGFMDKLGEIVGDQSGSNPKIVRTGMIPYNTDMISSSRKSMNWRLLTNNHISQMSAGGGTNSSTSMHRARNWIRREDRIHQGANGRTPLKYVVFMTDGVNNNNGSEWIEEAGTGEWRRTRCRYYNNWGWSCWTEEKTSHKKPPGKVGYWANNTKYDYEWAEGRVTMPDNEETLGYCQQIKDAGATVYTIGFALEAGVYGDGSTGTITQNDTETQIAYGFLRECASSPETFIAAENAEDLEAAFATIGEDIVTETVRIKS